MLPRGEVRRSLEVLAWLGGARAAGVAEFWRFVLCWRLVDDRGLKVIAVAKKALGWISEVDRGRVWAGRSLAVDVLHLSSVRVRRSSG